MPANGAWPAIVAAQSIAAIVMIVISATKAANCRNGAVDTQLRGDEIDHAARASSTRTLLVVAVVAPAGCAAPPLHATAELRVSVSWATALDHARVLRKAVCTCGCVAGATGTWRYATLCRPTGGGSRA